MPSAAQSGSTISRRIEEVLEAIRPALQIDGGDVEFVEFDGGDGVVRLRLVGACGGCPISSVTVKHGIERRLRSALPEVMRVDVV